LGFLLRSFRQLQFPVVRSLFRFANPDGNGAFLHGVENL